MAPIRRFSAAEKGKAPREEPDPLPPQKRLTLCRRDEGAHQVVSRPWCERPPPGFPLPLYAHIKGSEGVDADRHGRRRRRRRWVTKVWVVPLGSTPRAPPESSCSTPPCLLSLGFASLLRLRHPAGRTPGA